MTLATLLVISLTLTAILRHGDVPRILRRLTTSKQAQPPTIYVVTPTHTRLTQKADLTRLMYTLRHVSRLHWVLVEDHLHKTEMVQRMLNTSGLSYTHLNIATPRNSSTVKMSKFRGTEKDWRTSSEYKTSGKRPVDNNSTEMIRRGVTQRNEGLRWLRQHTGRGGDVGVVYFADDDNTYDVRLFSLMRQTRAVSVWPVGFVGKSLYEDMEVLDGRVVSWRVQWGQNRSHAVDMAGFAVNLGLIQQHPHANFLYSADIGFMESKFLQQFGLPMSSLEPVTQGVKEVLVWHTKTKTPFVKYTPIQGPVLEV